MERRPQEPKVVGSNPAWRIPIGLAPPGPRRVGRLERSPGLLTRDVVARADELEDAGDLAGALELGFVLPQHPGQLLVEHLVVICLGCLVPLGIRFVVRPDAGRLVGLIDLAELPLVEPKSAASTLAGLHLDVAHRHLGHRGAAGGTVHRATPGLGTWERGAAAKLGTTPVWSYLLSVARSC